MLVLVNPAPRPSAWKFFWQSLIRFQRDKVNPWIALRNTIGVTLPLIIGAASGSVTSGLIVATGALNVAFRDSDSPYPQRARHMLASSVIAGVAVFSGAITGSNPILAVAVAAIWAFGAGMLVAISQSAADLGLMSLVMLVVYGANPMQPHNAALAGLGAFVGGLLQTVLSLLLWPLRRYAPERRALGDLYLELSRSAAARPENAAQSPPATAQSLEAQTSLAALDRDRSAEGEQYRFVLSQAERIRLSLIALGRIRARLERENPLPAELPIVDHSLEVCSHALASIGNSIHAGEPATASSADLVELENLAERLRQASASPAVAAMIADARFQIDAIVGQLRSAVDVAAPLDSQDAPVNAGWRFRAAGALVTLRANLNLESAAFRHAIRLSISIAIGDALGRALGFVRPYWIPMTIAIVLKPDFSATFSRGILRLAGTYLGLLFATGLFHELPPSIAAYIIAIGAFMFIVRCIGPANYGILTAAVSALVVFLVSLTGISPREVIAARALNTAIGGAIALAGYWFWPTWERGQVSEAIARMLDAFRDYLHAVRESYGKSAPSSLDRARIAGRRARTNLEASIERASSEPGISSGALALLTGILASSRRLAQALMSLEAAIDSSRPVQPRPAFARFATDAERMLHQLAVLLRGSPVDPASLPDLREDHHALIHSADSGAEVYALVNVETDRITNSMNTLSADVVKWAATQNS